eukprot:TRINITY_DN110841_c0_g1_i1.p1 TRINITY_DN110841_c0_g1~~TRINITY_DN110841_c0_g1_i1.p1  ORF type:complete len:261 (-),score=41.27 TRINITY_DN110841_c0_g1_i1:14-721(-)
MMLPRLSPLSSFCCSCSVSVGTGFILAGHFLACVACVAATSAHFILHKDITSLEQTWSPELQLVVTMFMLMGIPIIAGGMFGVWYKYEAHVRFYLLYLLATFVVDVGMLLWGFVLEDPCHTARHVVIDMGRVLGEAFTCGVVRIASYLVLSALVLLEVYGLWCVWSFCEELAAGYHASELSSLILGKETVFVKHHQEPLKSRVRYEDYGTVTADGANRIFGRDHDTHFPSDDRPL